MPFGTICMSDIPRSCIEQHGFAVVAAAGRTLVSDPVDVVLGPGSVPVMSLPPGELRIVFTLFFWFVPLVNSFCFVGILSFASMF